MLVEHPYNKTSHEVEHALNTSRTHGLTPEEAVSRAKRYGKNVIPEKRNRTLLKSIIGQFTNPFIVILILALLLSIFIDHTIDAYVIGIVIVLNAAIGFAHDYKVDRSMRSLKKMMSNMARVIRNGNVEQIHTADIVPGDILVLEAGDKIPADARIFECSYAQVDESTLTGESSPRIKTNEIINQTGVPLADQDNMIMRGTFVVHGTIRAIVTGTGTHTSFGQIAESLQTIQKTKDHFSQQLARFSKKLVLFGLVLTTIIFCIGYFVNELPIIDVFFFSVASLVSIIPEGLPAAMGIILAIGATILAKKHAIVKNLATTESLSVVSHIITDKTGTLTENVMVVEHIQLLTREFRVENHGWQTKGAIQEGIRTINIDEEPILRKLILFGQSPNDSSLVSTDNGNIDPNGEPTESAIKVLAHKAGFTEAQKHITIQEKTPFDAETKQRTATVVFENKTYTALSGAPENIINHADLYEDGHGTSRITDDIRDGFHDHVQTMAQAGLRVIGVAYQNPQTKHTVLLGLFGIKDPIRKDVPLAIQQARTAGIRVIMATGDHPQTAQAIARDIGLLDTHQNVVTDSDIAQYSDYELDQIIETHSVFARVSPKTKLRLAQRLQVLGYHIAMTGDGVNDAPALKQADVGISMGKVGTDLARTTSDIILVDDNFATIIEAIKEGKRIFYNIQKAVTYIVSTNFAESVTIISVMAFGLPLPLLPTQILLLNLLTDGFGGLALAGEPAHVDLLKEKPIKKNEPIINKKSIPFLVIVTGLMVAATFLLLDWYNDDIETVRTMRLVMMSFAQFCNVFNLRSFTKSVFAIRVASNKLLLWSVGIAIVVLLAIIYHPATQTLFSLVPLSFSELMISIGLGSTVLFAVEIYKLFLQKKV